MSEIGIGSQQPPVLMAANIYRHGVIRIALITPDCSSNTAVWAMSFNLANVYRHRVNMLSIITLDCTLNHAVWVLSLYYKLDGVGPVDNRPSTD